MKRIPVIAVLATVLLVGGCEGTLPTETEEYLALESSFEDAQSEIDQLRVEVWETRAGLSLLDRVRPRSESPAYVPRSPGVVSRLP
jgi:hypothetical protein